jgi:uncharacterized protein YeeX (DUF496 family)
MFDINIQAAEVAARRRQIHKELKSTLRTKMITTRK